MKTVNQTLKTSRINRWIKPSVFGIASVVLLGMSGFASASDKDLVATTIPASACELSNSVQANKVHLSNGSWMFRSGATGGVIFNCPMPLNAFTVSDNSNDNDLTHFRVWYRDTDATGNQAALSARLKRRSTNGGLFFGPVWNSNNVNIAVHTAQIQPTLHDMALSGQYMIQVVMSRANASQNPMFTGIDFPNGSF